MGYAANEWSLWSEINCDIKSLWQFWKPMWFLWAPRVCLYSAAFCSLYSSHCLCHLHLFLFCWWYTMSFHKDNQGHGMPVHKYSRGMSTMTPCFLTSSVPSVPFCSPGSSFLTIYGFSVIQGGVERWRPREKLQGKKGWWKGSFTTQGSPGKQDRTNRASVYPLVWVVSLPAVWEVQTLGP